MNERKLKQLATFIRKHREDKGLSMNALAREARLDPATIMHLERGSFSNPSAVNLQKLARALDVAVEDFYAIVGYLTPEGLPEFAPYLRAKYNLSDKAVRELGKYFDELTKEGEKKGGRSGKSHR